MRGVVIAAALALSVASAHAQTVDTGLWVSRNAFGPDLAGELVVTRSAAGWRGAIGGVEVSGANLDLQFPDDRGRFTGVVAARSHVIDGWWTQPPGLPGQAYATPVRLYTTGGGVWRGAVAPLPQTFTLFLRMLRDDGGQTVAAFRNPEFNMNGGASRLVASRDDDTLTFSARDGGVRREGKVTGDRLRLAWPPVPQPLELTPARDDDPQWIARAAGAYAYRRPASADDGWQTAAAGAVGVSETALSQVVQRIVESDPAAPRPQLIHGLLVARRGKLILEEYFHGYDRDTPHDIRSAGKSLASVMLGAAMQQGVAIGPQTRIYDLLARRGPFANPDPRKDTITLAHLLTHTSGLDCNDNDEASAGNEGAMQGQGAQPDWARFALDLPMAHAPGARYAYCTAGMNLIGAALSEVTGESVPALFDRFVARPLRFGRYHWNLAPDGAGYLGGGAYLRPRDLLKVGQLYLDGGVWRGQRVVSRAWVRDSTAAHVTIDEASTGMDAATFAAIATHGADGYAWHRYGVRVGDARVEAFEANGNGGQFLIVIPSYETVLVLTGGNYGQGGIWTRWRDEIVGAQILAAMAQQVSASSRSAN